jgi:glycerol-3-phosphate dehydrogenase (NAD(P)+)
MNSTTPAAVIGGGSWGTALAGILAARGREVRLWVRDPELALEIEERRENGRYLPGARLGASLRPTADLADALDGAALVVSALPSHVVRHVMAAASADVAETAIVVSASKGIEEESLKRMSEVLGEVLGRDPDDRLAVPSGPSFAAEVARGSPTAVTLASHDSDVAESARQAFFAPRFRVYTSDDVVGVEIGGAVKNVVAIATGIADGLEYGHNARAALITRGLAEISRLGSALGGQRLTFMGLAGLGDLVLTCTGELSRNRTVGLRLARGENLLTILSEMRQVAEGVRSTRSVRDLAFRIDVEMPIVEQVYEMLYHAKSPQVVVEELMTRESKPEFQAAR